MIQKQIISAIDGIKSIEPSWNLLLESSAQKTVSLTPRWFRAWWVSFGARRSLSINCFYKNDALVAVAPMMREFKKIRGVRVSLLKSMTNGHTPIWDVIFSKDLSCEEQLEILNSIVTEPHAHMVVFEKVPELSNLGNLAKDLRGPFRVGDKPGFSTPIFRTTDDWDEFFKTRSRKFRQNIEKKIRSFNKLDGAEVECVVPESSLDSVFAKIVETSGRSWKASVGKDLESNADRRRFFKSLVDQFGPDRQVRIWVARVEGKTVAFEFHLVFNGTTFPLRADFDEAYRKVSPGSVVDFFAVRNSFEDPSISDYDSCADQYWYLSNWTKSERRQLSIQFFYPGFKPGWIYWLEFVLKPKLKSWGFVKIHQ